MMSPRDPDAGQFAALLADLAELQRQRGLAKSLPPPRRDAPRQTVPLAYFAKAAAIANARAARADLTRQTADLRRLEADVKRLAAERAAEGYGERRARARAAVQNVMDRVMRAFAAGNISAIEVARLEAHAHRVAAALEPGPTMQRGVA